MAEIKKEVKTYQKSYICDECGEGEMKPTDVCLASNPPKFPHECTKCGHTQNFIGRKYPYITYEVIGLETHEVVYEAWVKINKDINKITMLEFHCQEGLRNSIENIDNTIRIKIGNGVEERFFSHVARYDEVEHIAITSSIDKHINPNYRFYLTGVLVEF